MIIPGKPLHAETQRHVARMSSHDDQHIQDLDFLIRELVAGNVWDRLTCLCVVGPTAADSLLNLKHQSSDSELVGAPTFVADRGFTTVGTTDVINTNTSPASNMAANITFGFYARSSVVIAEFSWAMGGNLGLDYGGSVNIGQGSGGTPLTFFHPASVQVISALDTPAVGFCAHIGTIFGGNMYAGGLSGSITNPLGGSDGAMLPFIVGADAEFGTGMSNQYAAWFAGGAITASSGGAVALQTALQNYLTRRGAAV